MTYGLQQVIESADSYIESSGNSTNKTIHLKLDSGFNYLDYYYQAAYLIRPATVSLIKLVNQAITLGFNNMDSMLMWMIGGLLIYICAYVTIMISYILYLRKEQGHYSVFYTIIPKEMRLKNDALRKYVTQLIKITD